MNTWKPTKYSQSYRMTCGPTAIRLCCDLLWVDHIPSEDALIKTCRSWTDRIWTTKRQIQRWLYTTLKDTPHRVQTVTWCSLDTLKTSVKRSKLALVLMMTDRKNNPHAAPQSTSTNPYGLHRVVVRSISSKSVTILNPFWFVEEQPIEEFVRRRSLHKSYCDNIEKTLKILHIIRPRTAFIFS